MLEIMKHVSKDRIVTLSSHAYGRAWRVLIEKKGMSCCTWYEDIDFGDAVPFYASRYYLKVLGELKNGD